MTVIVWQDAAAPFGDSRARDVRRRYGLALAWSVAVLVVWNVVARPLLPAGADLFGGLVVAALLVAGATWAGVRPRALGLSPARVGSGLAWGGIAVAVVVAVVATMVAVPATRDVFRVDRGDVGLGTMLVEVFVTIPVGTVVVEELAFRGVLLGLLGGLVSPVRAVVLSSALFGLWHVGPVLSSSDGGTGGSVGLAVGTFAATGAAGTALCWLRLRSGSLVAPALAHFATNASALVAAWIVSH